MSENAERSNTQSISAIDMMNDAAEQYAREVIISRAIPDLRDGLKPVQRKIIWQTHLDKLGPKKKPISVATVVGETMKWHPHGDGSIESALTNLARPWLNIMPLLRIFGSGGSIDDAAAQGRYIKVRQTEASLLMTRELSKGGVELEPNHDNTGMMPGVLPSALPAALIWGQSGIAWSLATNLLPHNPIELLNVARLILKKPDASTSEILDIMPGPDFASGGVLVGQSGSRDEIDTGRGRFIVKGRTRVQQNEEDPRCKQIEIYETPPGLSSESLVRQIERVIDPIRTSYRVESIINSTEESDVSIRINFERNASDEHVDSVDKILYAKTDLQTSMSANNTLVHEGSARVFSVRDYIKAFLDFRREVLINVRKFELGEVEKDIDVTTSRIVMFDHAREVADIASNADSRASLIQSLCESLSITNAQAEYIAGQPIYRLSKDAQDNLEIERENLAELEGKRDTLNNEISSFDLMTRILDDDLKSTIEMLGDKYPRVTEVASEDALVSAQSVKLSASDTVESKPVVVVARDDMSVIRIGEKAFENQAAAPKGDAKISCYVYANTDEFVMFITKKGRAVTRLVNDLVHANLSDNAAPLNHDIESLERDDEIIDVMPIRDDQRLIVITDHGYAKCMSAKKIAPKTTTRAYFKKTVPVAGLKSEGDTIAFTKVFTDAELTGEGSIDYESIVRGKPKVLTIELDRVTQRDDSGGSSGARYLKPGSDGSAPRVKSVNL